MRGFARRESGEPVPNGGLVPVPQSPPAAAIEEMGYRTQPDGSYQLLLPPATYTIQVFADSPSGTPLYGEVTGVVVAAGRPARADIVVTERPPDPSA